MAETVAMVETVAVAGMGEQVETADTVELAEVMAEMVEMEGKDEGESFF